MFLFETSLKSLADTHSLGCKIEAFLKKGDVVFLNGDLGVGKTTLVKAILEPIVGETVTSPTFTLVNEYQSPKHPYWHVDLYRLDAPEEFFELGVDEMMPHGVTFIEWPERLGRYQVADPLEIFLTDANGLRTVKFKAGPSWNKRIIDAF